MQPDFTIVIAHRGPTMGLWATIHSCEIELAKSDLTWNYVFVSNGEAKPDVDAVCTIRYLKNTGRVLDFQHYAEPLSPPVARQRGAAVANGRILAFFDNHCLVAKDYFRRAAADMPHFKMDMLHSSTNFYGGDHTHYHYKLKLNANFWAESSFFPQHPLKPYRVGMAGHGGFMVKRKVWEEVGGYGPEGLFDGYGGEESYFDLKMALLDKTNWIDPKIIHWHYAGKRPYARHYTDEYYRNMMTCAYVIGGYDWLMRVYESFTTKWAKKMTGKSMFDLMVQAEERGRDHARYLASIRHRTLDEQLALFNREMIAIN